MAPWPVKDLPAAPPYTFRNILSIIGPGTIALSVSIGTGEWILGPQASVKAGLVILWIVTLSVFFQLILNFQFIRYSLYTGEPATQGFMRTAPGPKFWGVVYVLMALCQFGWPAWAANSAAPLFAAFTGHLPIKGQNDNAMFVMGISNFLLAVVIVAMGGKVERMLEWVNWFMVIFIFGFLVVACVWFVPGKIWGDAFMGHFQFGDFGKMTGNVDWILLGGFAAFAGNGGMGNVVATNWIRDKGFGMGSLVGYIPSAIGGKVVKVSPTGSVFPPTPENMSRWKTWWRYVRVDQVWVWAVGCILGMYFNVILAVHFIPPGTQVSGLQAGAFLADRIREQGGSIMAFLALLNGFWILWGSQLVIVDCFTRLATDVLWSTSPRVRALAKDDIRKVYYVLVLVFATWGCIAINVISDPGVLVKIAANVAGFIFVVVGIHILVVQHKLMPKEVRSPAWQQGVVVLAVLFFGFFAFMNAKKLWNDLTKPKSASAAAAVDQFAAGDRPVDLEAVEEDHVRVLARLQRPLAFGDARDRGGDEARPADRGGEIEPQRLHAVPHEVDHPRG